MSNGLEKTLQKTFLERLIFMFGCALIVFFFSEFYFFNEGPVEDLVNSITEPLKLGSYLAQFSGWYLLGVAPALLLISHVGAHNLASLFLCGCIAGYCIEGLMVPAIYLELPISLFWTSLSWHPIIDVVFGLWIWQMWLRQNGFWFNLLVCLSLGASWGLWSTWPIGEPSDTKGEILGFMPLGTYAGFVFVATLVLFIGLLLTHIRPSRVFVPKRTDWIIFGLTSLVLFVFIALQVSYLALILPLVLALCYWPLRWLNNISKSSILSVFEIKVSLSNLAAIWAMPVGAIAAYWFLSLQNWQIESWVLALPMIVVGGGLAIGAALKLYRARQS